MGTLNDVHEDKRNSSRDKTPVDPSQDEGEHDEFGLPRKRAQASLPDQVNKEAERDEERKPQNPHAADDRDSPANRPQVTSESSLEPSGSASRASSYVENNDVAVAPTWPSHAALGSDQDESPPREPVEHRLDGGNIRSSTGQASACERRPATPPSQMKRAQDEQAASLGSSPADRKDNTPSKKGKRPLDGPAVSEWSHQRLASQHEKADEEEEEDEWQAMPAFAPYDLYDDNGKLLARGAESEDEEEVAYGGLGGAGKGYTRVQLDEDAKSATSMDEDTNYLFKENQKPNDLDDEDQRDAVSQLQATKDLLTEGQRIAYVGVTRLAIYNMNEELEDIETTGATKKEVSKAAEDMTKWGQQMMVRLYAHMEIDSAEQIMIEQLAEHGVQPADLVPPLMQNSRVLNPMADERRRSNASPGKASEGPDVHASTSIQTEAPQSLPLETDSGETVPSIHTPSHMEYSAKIDLDLRWTVMCDLFLLLISDAVYDSRSRRLLEQVAKAMDITWIQICRFEKRVIDALEVREEKEKETWDEGEHMETRRKLGLKKKYMVMGIATVGGGLVIGLSAGLLAPVIGAGLAAGFTTIGVTGTAGFLGGVGGAAIITSAATAAGGTIAVRASHRRTGAVQTFEYRPLHNNKRLNLVLTVSGWMNGKIDDVRLPFSTVDPIMGDIYSLLWEPEMLQSMGDTINILATEALTQTVQQVLGSTILVALMASLQLPIVLTKLAYLIDNPWTVSLDRANSAGLILADSLIDRHLGNRPITLLGFSLGSRVIFSCLKELARRHAYGIVQNVYLFGSPIVAKRDEYLRARSVISGRFVNGYASNDWILGYLFRATSGGIMRVAGLAPVEGIPGLENLDVTHLVNGHMAYRTAMPKLLREVGWEVEADEFTEIEDPDPENHQKRQRELIREIDEARKQAEVKPEKKRFGFFKRGKLAKKGWETYQADSNSGDLRDSTDDHGGLHDNVLFDIEAIKKELESEMIEVRQLESTLPPMQLSLDRGFSQQESRPDLRQTRPSNVSKDIEGWERHGILDPSSTQPLPEGLANLRLPPRPSEIDDEPCISNGIHGSAQRTPHESNLPPSPPATYSTDWTPPPSASVELQRSATTPAGVDSSFRAMHLERNAWAEEEQRIPNKKA